MFDSHAIPRRREDGASATRPDLPLLLQAFASLAMTALIWFVQIVHYPLLSAVGSSGYAAYQA